MTASLTAFLRQHRNELGLLAAILAVIAITATIDDSYREKPGYNAKEILRQTSMLGIFALGAAIVIISGGIDLSSGAVIAMSSTVCGSILFALSETDANGIPMTETGGIGILTVAILGTLFVGFLIGSFHAWLVTAVNLPPFVATLASLVGLRSLARVLIPEVTREVSGIETTKLYVYHEQLAFLGETWWVALAVFATLALALWVLMSRTVIGRHIYAMGGNEAAAQLSGIRTDRLKWLAYCIGAVTASIAGILYTGYVGTSDPTTLGMGYELNAIAAVVVGGCSLTGGIGTILGTALGALFLRAVIDAVAKTIKSGADDYEGMIVGVLVVLAVALNALRTDSGLARQFFNGKLGSVSIGILTLLSGTITFVMVETNKISTAWIVVASVLALLSLRKYLEVAAMRKKSAL